jgi:hypothetical protein
LVHSNWLKTIETAFGNLKLELAGHGGGLATNAGRIAPKLYATVSSPLPGLTI